MFQTMMAKQPDFQNTGYKLFDAGFATLSQLARGPLSKLPEEERNALYNAFRAGFDDMQDEIEDAQKNGKQTFLKEHALLLSGPDKLFDLFYRDDGLKPIVLTDRNAPDQAHTNPTSIPDSFLLRLRPIFQIRHPILMFPSVLRTEKKALGTLHPKSPLVAAALTLSHSRALYDWYLNHEGGPRPQVIDADDIMTDKSAVRRVCIETGLDPDAVQYEWETREEPNPVKAVFLSTIYASKGILPGLSSQGLKFETEKAKWKAEFGDDDGEDLAKFVLDAMPDYDYLLSQRTYINRQEASQRG
ncbi:hypothetical protein GRF29_185g241002 [Pseudopithomyces chartarum]|uniref:Uncharacterized protein n=1 Tax=Pseudopithomyces chartarum TaxID=1892770 RepID=A0AAN6LQJ2_9PLEO|nr:hypothetical protein GRF29_185g241002 [Pseudopithomyces chartarum]